MGRFTQILRPVLRDRLLAEHKSRLALALISPLATLKVHAGEFPA